MINSHFPLILVIFFILLAIIIVTKSIMKRRSQDQGEQIYPYEKKQPLFSPAERSFLGALEQSTNNRFRFMCKIRLADIVKVKNGLNNKDRQTSFNKINSKHVDFIACDPATLNVVFVIELDDKSHNQLNTINRDNFVDNVMEASCIPIIHFTAKKSYSLQEIQNILSQAGL